MEEEEAAPGGAVALQEGHCALRNSASRRPSFQYLGRVPLGMDLARTLTSADRSIPGAPPEE